MVLFKIKHDKIGQDVGRLVKVLRAMWRLGCLFTKTVKVRPMSACSMHTGLLQQAYSSVANLAVFPQIWVRFFVELWVFSRLGDCLFLGLFWLKCACFLQISALWIAFFQILWHFFCFNVLLKAIWEFFGENMLILGLFFWMCPPVFLFNFPANFLFC